MPHPALTPEKRIGAELRTYDGKMSVYADDLRGGVIERDADEPFETASTIKTFLLAALFDRIGRGEASLTEELEYREEEYVSGSGVIRDLAFGSKMPVYNLAVLMITVSDNIAANMLIDYLGVDGINESIGRLGFRQTVLHNSLHFDRYRRLGTTTPREYGTLFARLSRGELVSPESDGRMIAILRRQHTNTMLTRDFPPVLLDSEDTGEEELFWVASKSGSMDAVRADGGIVHTPCGEYVLVLMSKEFSDPIYYPEHPALVFGGRVSRMLLERYLALEGRFRL